ncbi:MAG TPA: hypothetical protein VFS53_01930 [Gemmatimonadota bacterium]|nr:hypothetical protein [Gemmatimonadota bacterium]
MKLTCPQCGTVYDVTQYPEGHTFQCQCGNELKVGPQPASVAAAGPGTAPPAPVPSGPDPGLQPIVKVLVFIANLCFSPLAAIASVVVYFVIKDQKPRTAKDLCQMTWIPFVVWAVLVGLYFLFMGTMIFSGIMGSAGTY